MMSRRFPWASWSDERLLQLRVKDLGLSIEGTWLEPRIDALYETLERRGFRLRPHIWLSEEWFSPQGVPGFAIPFYLAHPRLIRLERSQMLDVEGGTRDEFTRIMRHETGHAIQHGYQLQRRREWQRLFGKSSQRYPEYYRPNPASKRYVQHLRLWYAQSHPDEDFAETFAVWLRPRGEWRKRYAGWPALKKLEYVDELMSEIAGKPSARRDTTAHGADQHRSRRHSRSTTPSVRRSTPRCFLIFTIAICAASFRIRRRIAISRSRRHSCGAIEGRSGGSSRSGRANTSSRSTSCLARCFVVRASFDCARSAAIVSSGSISPFCSR